MTIGTRKAGEFCWINMLTPDPSDAREFFGKLLGWTFFEMPGIGHGIVVGGRNVGGLFDLNGPGTPPGLSPMIGVMIKVADADAASAKVTPLGGRAKPPFDVGKQGRMAVCFDPIGAEFDIWEPKSMLGTDVDPTLPGAPCRFETVTTDLGRASTFYSDLFGWTAEHGDGVSTFRQGDGIVAGMRPIPPEIMNIKPQWITYFTVNDTDVAARESLDLGAEIVSPATDRPGVGRVCGIRSPQGVAFYVVSDAR